MTLTEIREKRANVWEQMKGFLADADAEGRDLSGEEATKYDAAEVELNGLTAQIDRREKHEKLDKSFETITRDDIVTPDSPGDTAVQDAAYRGVFDAYMRGGMPGLDPEQRKVIAAARAEEVRAQGVGSGSIGGFSVPQGFRDKIQESLKKFGGVTEVAEPIITGTGADLPWPTNDDTANKGARLAENTQITEQDIVLGQKTLKAHVYTSKLVRVAWQLLQDTGFDLESFLARKLGQRIGRILNDEFTVGTGTTMPEGIQTNAVAGKQGIAGQTTSVIYDDLIDVIHSVDAAYREGGACRWMMNDLSLAKVRKLKDSQNRPLWQPSVVEGIPDTILGYGVKVNNDIPVMGASVRSILFGDFFAGYAVRTVVGVNLVRLEERYADFLQVGFFAWARHDGIPQDTAAYKAYQNSAT